MADLHSTMLLLYRVLVNAIKAKIVYLHSTMLLLYPDVASVMGIDTEIYIHLCFYFIGVEMWCAPADIVIYIPLCFYFIVDFSRVHRDLL